jgi:hypothetical protein
VSGIQLATASTALWVVATVALFILLAGWSTGTSWGLTATIVRGVRGWSDRDGRPIALASPGTEALRPMLDPYAFMRRDARPPTGPASPVVPAPLADAPGIRAPEAEVIELGERRLP